MQVRSTKSLLSVFAVLSAACGLQHLSPEPVAGGGTFYSYNNQTINISTSVPYPQCLHFSLLPVNFSILSLHLCLQPSSLLLTTRAYGWCHYLSIHYVISPIYTSTTSFKSVWPNHIHVVYRKQFHRIRGIYTAPLNRFETTLKTVSLLLMSVLLSVAC